MSYTKYHYGAALERQVQNELREYGYTSLRSSASKGVIDVLAFRQGEYLFVQCKRGGRLDPDEWNDLYHLAQENNAIPLLALKKDSGVGNRYWRLIGEKVPHTRTKPVEIWTPTAPGQGALWE